MKYYGKIVYTIDKNHPDVNCIVGGWHKGKILDFEDVYTFDEELYDNRSAIAYIKKDLKLIAGGGYNSDHIHNVMFDIYRME